MNHPAIDPHLLALDRTPAAASQTLCVVSVPIGTWARVRPFIRGTSSPLPHSPRVPSTSDVLGALLLCIEQLEVLTDDQDKKLWQLQDQVTTFKRRLEDAGLGVDDVGVDADNKGQVKRKKKKKKGSERLLTEKSKKLTEKERQVHREFVSLLTAEMKKLSGTPDNSPVPTENLPPGGYTLANGMHILLLDFTRDVTDSNNEQLINEATHLVFDEQKDSAAKLFKLCHKDVAFTEQDVYWLGKDAFRSWKASFVRETDNAAKAKAALQTKKNTRGQRKRQKKIDRLEMNEEYMAAFGVDPTPLLLTDWMSDYVSSLEDGDEDEKRYHRTEMETAVGFVVPRRQGEGEKPVIWERVRPAFRSDEINLIYGRLDTMCKSTKWDVGKKGASHTCVDLGRVNNRILSVSPFPFMVDETWCMAYIVGRTLEEPFVTKHQDLAGFGMNDQEM